MVAFLCRNNLYLRGFPAPLCKVFPSSRKMSIVEWNVQNKENDFVSSNQVLTVVLIVLCLVLLLSFVANKATTSPARDVEVASPPVLLPEGELLEPVPERKSITEDEIDKLYLGYTYEELEDLFGISADERESEYRRDATGYTAPHTIVWYTWKNPDDTVIRLGFINNKLERKQFIRKDGTVISNEIKLDDVEL